jgi:hypothetical protein
MAINFFTLPIIAQYLIKFNIFIATILFISTIGNTIHDTLLRPYYPAILHLHAYTYMIN